MIGRRSSLVLCLLASLGLAAPAAAQVDADESEQAATLERARVRFEEGVAAHEVGRFEEALEAFQEAYALTDNPDLLYNVASTADRLRRDAVALEAYQGYLAARPESPDRVQVEARIRVLSERVAEEQAEAAAAAAEQERRDAEAAQLRDRLAEAEQNPRTVVVERGDAGPAPWIVLGAGVAAAAVGAALVAVSSIDAECVAAPEGCAADPSMPSWSEVAERYDRIPTFTAVGSVLLGLGGVAIAVGLGWGIATLGGGDDEQSATLRIGPSGLTLEGSFQ